MAAELSELSGDVGGLLDYRRRGDTFALRQSTGESYVAVTCHVRGVADVFKGFVVTDEMRGPSKPDPISRATRLVHDALDAKADADLHAAIFGGPRTDAEVDRCRGAFQLTDPLRCGTWLSRVDWQIVAVIAAWTAIVAIWLTAYLIADYYEWTLQ